MPKKLMNKAPVLILSVTAFIIVGSVLVVNGSIRNIPLENVKYEVSDTIPKGEILYNGIQLPDIWPPKNESPTSSDPMGVPYLNSPPEIIPINIGRQLFIDDFLIEETNLKRVFHQPHKHEDNPVFIPQTKYELAEKHNGFQESTIYLGHGGVFFDPEYEVFKMFYTAGWRGGLALATSVDLLHWKRPTLGLFDENIILPKGGLFAGGDNAIWLDRNSGDTNARYKLLINRSFDKNWKNHFSREKLPPSHTLHISPNGKIWSTGLGIEGNFGDYSSFFYNPFRSVWVFSIKKNGPRGRARYYLESTNFLAGLNWNQSVYWVNADNLDYPDELIGDIPQLYSLNAVAYESVLLGEFYIHLGPPNNVAEKMRTPKITEIKIGFSRDGFHWYRPDREPFIPASRNVNDWDKGYIHGTMGVCLVVGDSLWFPYTGFSGISPNGSKGMYTGASVGMATLRRDGFASMNAGQKTGSLTTRNISFNGRHLFVNVDCPEGDLKVEILDVNNKVLPPFTMKNCINVKVNKTIHEIRWKGCKDMSQLINQPVKFRFYLTNGSLYSFWVSADEDGASNGYIGAGGPGFPGVLDSLGLKGYKTIKY